MEVGQGIHGEPGVGEQDLASAAEVAHMLVDRVLAEAPANDNKRIAVILDGLGSTKYEELFVVWGTARELLEARGYTLVEPLVGEYVTSLDMEGIALSVEFLTDELERYWKAPAATPAFRKGSSEGLSGVRRTYASADNSKKSYASGSRESREAARFLADAFIRIQAAVAEAESELAKIDGVAGDGDHGRGMVKGTSFAADAASEAYEAGAAAGSLLIEAGHAWASKAGGTSGVLWGEALEAAGRAIGDTAENYDTRCVAAAVQAACERMRELGGAHLGDKTMLDALIPFSHALQKAAQHGDSLADAWVSASQVADRAAKDTAQLIPKVGRARPAAERSVGTPDAGAISMALIFRAVL